ncbi:MAG: FAD-dependent oxidoreductase [Nannocystis sp.]|uniref:NAD(P)/FAD-dependent oxidoreductase n=1 Tax=Nannocystis sp. TaxID=1962667 RepID=UPI002426AF08|nr:FAD-binding oxidoreductase [Nannocystis sp.]MBK9753003.1 FAD-dependent oxidoreductase [Nannocystis sp.]
MRQGLIDDNRSAWLEALPPYERLPALRGHVSADLAIIGGGITGVSTAWHLAERYPDRRIVLLEARGLGNGASGRNGGQVLNGINGVEPREATLAQRVFAATSAGIDIVEALAAASTIDCGFSRRGCLEVYTTEASAREAEARVATWRDWGLPMRWLAGNATGNAIGMHGIHGAVLDPTAGMVNCAALLRGLRPRLLARGVTVHEDTPVLRVEHGQPVILHTAEGSVRAAAVVVATNAYTPQLGLFTRGILPLHSHVVATAPLSAERWQQLGLEGFADDLDRIAYGGRMSDGRMLFGGGSNAAYTCSFGGSPVFPADAGARNFAAIEARMRGYFPGLADVPVTHRWTGPLAITFDRICSMGVTGPHRNIYYALGYSGHGLALGALAGRVLRDLYSDDHGPWQGLPFFQKRLPIIPPEPFRWLGYQLYTRLTGRSPRQR